MPQGKNVSSLCITLNPYCSSSYAQNHASAQLVLPSVLNPRHVFDPVWLFSTLSNMQQTYLLLPLHNFHYLGFSSYPLCLPQQSSYDQVFFLAWNHQEWNLDQKQHPHRGGCHKCRRSALTSDLLRQMSWVEPGNLVTSPPGNPDTSFESYSSTP